MPRCTSLALVAVASLALLGALARPGHANPVAPTTAEILPLDQVRPGMRGVVYTVTNATRQETFEVEVLDVIRNHQPKQHAILVRCLGENIRRMGIAQGMSGSPVFIDGKLVGAMALTWGWAKEPLGGITPIESMLAEGRRPLEGRPTGADPTTPLRQPRLRRGEGAESLREIGAPVCLGGFSAAGRARAAEELTALGFAAHTDGGVVAGAPASWANLDAEMVPGAALTIDLVRGDLAISVLGTCTWVEGDKVYGFGHPFESLGETLFPMSVGYVYTIVPSRNISFKLGAPLREVGAVIQDRAPGVVGVLGMKAPMVPVEVTLRNAVTEHAEDFRFEVTANRVYFQRLLNMSLREAIARAEPTVGPVTKKYRIEIKLAGVDEPWSYEDAFVTFGNGFSRVLVGLVDKVMIHPTQRAAMEWVKLDVTYGHRDERVSIERVTPSVEEARPGETVELVCRMRRRDGGELFLQRLAVTIPENAPAGDLGITVTSGDSVQAHTSRPVDLMDIQRVYDAFYKATELVALLPTGRADLDVDGTLYENLPLSAIPRLVRSTDAVNPKVYPTSQKVRFPVPYIVAGLGRAVIRVLR